MTRSVDSSDEAPKISIVGSDKEDDDNNCVSVGWLQNIVLVELEKIDGKIDAMAARLGHMSMNSDRVGYSDSSNRSGVRSDTGRNFARIKANASAHVSPRSSERISSKPPAAHQLTDVLKRVNRKTTSKSSENIMEEMRAAERRGDEVVLSTPMQLDTKPCDGSAVRPAPRRSSKLSSTASALASLTSDRHKILKRKSTIQSADLSEDQQLLEEIWQEIQRHQKVDHRGKMRTAVWYFLEQPFSSRVAYLYSIFVPLFVVSSVATSFLRTLDSRPSAETDTSNTIMQVIFETFFSVELLVRYVACPDRMAFWFNVFNHIDLVSAMPLLFRISAAILSALGKGEGASDVMEFIQIVPMLRLMKLTRRFEKFQLLLSAFQIAFEALPVLLYTLMLLALIFSACVYFVEPAENIGSMPTALWLTIVTMTTVGYGDITPETVAGHVIIMLLMVISALYMAIPIGIVGNAFSQVWGDRDRLLLMSRMREAFSQCGFTPHSINEIIQLFDSDCSGVLNLAEFCVMMKVMHINLSQDRIVQVFDNLDRAKIGSIKVQDIVDTIFPKARIQLTYFDDSDADDVDSPGRDSTASESPALQHVTGVQSVQFQCLLSCESVTDTSVAEGDALKTCGKTGVILM